jgi:hypothetical protein
MGVETSTTISGLNATWPLGSDPKSEGDNHIRMIKDVLQRAFDDSVAAAFGFKLVNTKLIYDSVAGTLSIGLYTGAGVLIEDVKLIDGGLAVAGLAAIVDPTKQLALDFSNLATATVRSMRIPAANVASVPGLWEPIADDEITGAGSTFWSKTGLGAYRALEIELNIYNVTVESSFDMQISTDNGATWGGAAYQTQNDYGQAAAAVANSVGAASVWPLSFSTVVRGSQGLDARVKLGNWNQAARYKTMNAQIGFVGTVSGNLFSGNAYGFNNVGACNALKVISANAFIGRASLMGLRA